MPDNRGSFVRVFAVAAMEWPLRLPAIDESRAAVVPNVARTAASYADEAPLADMLEKAKRLRAPRFVTASDREHDSIRKAKKPNLL